jgi:hypothetical protein
MGPNQHISMAYILTNNSYLIIYSDQIVDGLALVKFS